MDENKDIIKEVEDNGKKYTIQYLKGQKLDRNIATKKVILLGLSGVGKTTISYRLITEEFKQCSPTISLDLAGYKIKVNDKVIQIQIWDSCGNDEFAASTPNLFKNTFIGIFVYEIVKRDSFNQIEKWKNLLRQHSKAKFVYLIGNKSDLEENRQVETHEGESYKNEFNFNVFMETSAKSGLNIDNLLNRIAIDVYESTLKEEEIEEIEKNTGRISLKKEDLGDEDNEQGKIKKRRCC